MSNVVLPFPYSLPMPKKVKKHRDRTRISAKHQVTIPASAFHAAGLAVGDTLRVEADGAGRVVLTRVDELLDRYAGCVDTGGSLRAAVEGLRDEWR
jgi:bifunctional DNA-binding transcriptional regulator/antitoxin component of YhaV-PrlF toxin-antitoxin module